MVFFGKKTLKIMQSISTQKIIKKILQLPLVLIGLAIVKITYLNKYKLHLLSTWADVEKRNKVDEILYKYVFFLWFEFEYLKEKDPDKRETLKSICMGGKGGKKGRGKKSHYG